MGKKFNIGLDESFDISKKSESKFSRYLQDLEDEIAKPREDVSADLKRINMAFTDPNYEMILEYSERYQVTMAHLINVMARVTKDEDIEDYITSLPIKPTKNHVRRKKGARSKRINIYFENDVYEKIEKGAEKHNMTLTQYLNIVLSVYNTRAIDQQESK